MIKKLCPVCDHVMTTGHFCANCRSFVRHPNIIDADYYLNETHPPFESDCDFHNPIYSGETADRHPVFTGTVLNESGKAVRQMKETLAGNLARSREGAAGDRRKAEGNARNRNPFRIIFIFVLVYMLLMSLLGTISAVLFG
jgi:hypothetical protein